MDGIRRELSVAEFSYIFACLLVCCGVVDIQGDIQLQPQVAFKSVFQLILVAIMQKFKF